MSPDTSDWDSMEEIAPVPSPEVVAQVRFTLDEFARAERAAAEGQKITEYVKQSALRRVVERAAPRSLWHDRVAPWRSKASRRQGDALTSQNRA
jgi:hypothetical protein